MADARLTADEQVLAAATKRAVQALGGLDIASRETGLSDTQLSRCCSPNHRDSLTLRAVATIESLTHGNDGHPHILHALARVVGGVIVVPVPEFFGDGAGLVQSTLDIATELGGLSCSISDAMHESSAAGAEVTPGEAAVARERLDALDRASARLRLRLNHIAEGGKSTE